MLYLYITWDRSLVLRARAAEGLPDEGDLLLVHPGLQLQAGVLPKGRHDQAEHQGDAHKHSREHDLAGEEDTGHTAVTHQHNHTDAWHPTAGQEVTGSKNNPGLCLAR